MTAALWAVVEEKLGLLWSPEQIAGPLRAQGVVAVGKTWIYHPKESVSFRLLHVWSERASGGTLFCHLRRRTGAGCGVIPGRIDICERPAVVEEKSRVGDWLKSSCGGLLSSEVSRHRTMGWLGVGANFHGECLPVDSKSWKLRGWVLPMTGTNIAPCYGRQTFEQRPSPESRVEHLINRQVRLPKSRSGLRCPLLAILLATVCANATPPAAAEVLFSDDFSSGDLDKWTVVGKGPSGASPDPGRMSVSGGVMAIEATAGANYDLRVVKDIVPVQRHDQYWLSFDWKAVTRETPYGLDGVRLSFFDSADQLIGVLQALNSGQTGRADNMLEHSRPEGLADDQYTGLRKLAETFDWEAVEFDTSMIPGMDPADVAWLELRAWVYNDAGSGGEMHFDNFELRHGQGSNALASYNAFHVIAHNLNERQNHDAECKAELGQDVRLADWNDIVAYYKDGGSLADFVAGLRMSVERQKKQPGEITSFGYRVTDDGQPRWSGRRHYFFTRHEHNKRLDFLAHAHLDNYYLSLA